MTTVIPNNIKKLRISTSVLTEETNNIRAIEETLINGPLQKKKNNINGIRLESKKNLRERTKRGNISC